jgi:quercetin dioxygenase-like cupin family protein
MSTTDDNAGAPGPAHQAAESQLDGSSVRHYRWQSVREEALKPGLSRRLITGERMMIAHVYLKKGADVPRHSHENEQITYVLEGVLHFWLGANDEREVTVRAGEVLVIPSNVPHRALAIEDTLDMDVFNPPRQDWLDGSDAYIRR